MQTVTVPPNTDTVIFSCNMQLTDQAKRTEIRYVQLLNSSCDGDRPFLIRAWRPKFSLNVSHVFKEGNIAQFFLKNFSVKLNYSAFKIRGQRLCIRCLLRLKNTNSAVSTRTEIIPG